VADIFVSVGSNIRRRSSIRKGMLLLYKLYGRLEFSAVRETKAVGFNGAPFYNFVVRFKTDDLPKSICLNMKDIEVECGRSRKGPKFNARTLDLDLLLYDDLQIETDTLQLPRDEIFKYSFVLQPLSELVPEMECPGTEQTFSQLWSAFQRDMNPDASKLLDWAPIRASLLT